VRVVVGKIEGVRSVKVSLKEGVATIDFSPENLVTLARIREAIRSNGFTAREAEVRVMGSLVRRGDTLTLVVPGTGETFLLDDAPGSARPLADLRRRAAGARLLLTGRVPRPARRESLEPDRLLVRTVAGA
jgi:Heavy-metal-associated domain